MPADDDSDLLAEICDDPDDEETDYGRGYRTGYDVGYAEGRRDGAAEQATAGLCGTELPWPAVPGAPLPVCSLLAGHPGWHRTSNGCYFTLGEATDA